MRLDDTRVRGRRITRPDTPKIVAECERQRIRLSRPRSGRSVDAHHPVQLSLACQTACYQGGTPFEGPWCIVAANITPDKEHGGIGDWTDDQIRGALTPIAICAI